MRGVLVVGCVCVLVDKTGGGFAVRVSGIGGQRHQYMTTTSGGDEKSHE